MLSHYDCRKKLCKYNHGMTVAVLIAVKKVPSRSCFVITSTIALAILFISTISVIIEIGILTEY